MDKPSIGEVLKSLVMVAVLILLALALGIAIQLVGNLLLYLTLTTLFY